MDLKLVDEVAKAVLFEGYLLYPYRPSAVKNRQRWNFGTLVPPAFAPLQGDSDSIHAEVLAVGHRDTRLEIRVRFLHIQDKTIEESTVQQATERELVIPIATFAELASETKSHEFSLGGKRESEILRGLVQHPIDVSVEVNAERLDERLFKIGVRTRNMTAMEIRGTSRDEALLRSMASTHMVLGIQGGEFISLADPPTAFAEAAGRCNNKGVWPVLAGRAGERDCMLCLPIILSDYPRIAPESTGDLFDSTEIDELLTLRVLTLTDQEKREMAEADPRGRHILERAESLSPEQMMGLHGAVRSDSPLESAPFEKSSGPVSVRVAGADLKAGDRVRLRPRAGGDVFDIVLAGRSATIESIEQDLEGKFHIAVTVDDDPGRDLGMLRQTGHRFFFCPAEVEPL